MTTKNSQDDRLQRNPRQLDDLSAEERQLLARIDEQAQSKRQKASRGRSESPVPTIYAMY